MINFATVSLNPKQMNNKGATEVGMSQKIHFGKLCTVLEYAFLLMLSKIKVTI